MLKYRPTKWALPALAGVGLPMLAAAVISTNGLKADIADRTAAALAANEALSWAKVQWDGRDAVVSGTTTSQQAVDEAVKAVAGTYGVRTVTSAGAQVVELVAPTVESGSFDSLTPEIRGTWPEGTAKSLVVTVDKTAYNLPGSPELTSSAGNWLLKLTTPLAAGDHEVTVTAHDGPYAAKAVEAPGKITVNPPDVTGPVAPSVAAVAAGAVWPYAITGTFDAADTSKLTAALAGQEYIMGTSPELTTDGKGSFTFAPTATLAPGSHAVDVAVYDAKGNVTLTKAAATIVIPEPVAPAPEPVEEEVSVPTLAPVPKGASWPYPITGTFDAKDTVKLTAKLAEKEYVANTDAELVTKSDGTFVFAPTATLAPGTYDVDIAAFNKTGEAFKTTLQAAIVIPEPAEVAPPPAAQVETTPPPPEPAPAAAPAPEVVVIPAPTVIKQLDLTGAPIIKGTWSGADSLNVEVGGKTYELGKSANLAADDKGNWRLMPSAALKDGTYDVVVTAAKGTTAVKDETLGELTVDATLPAVPTVNPVSATEAPKVFTGTYDPKLSASLSVAVPKLMVKGELGQPDTPLTADGDGNWTLTLPAAVVPAPGTYDIVVTATDKHGRTVADVSNEEVAIAAANEPAPPVPPPYDCEAVINRIHTVFPMRFIYARVDFAERFGLSVDQYAALLKDPRCAAIKVEVGGHADDRGTPEYNMGLAERRAAKVRDMLVTAGVDAGRLTVKSYGESMPLETTETEESWAKNRRVEINVSK